MTQLEMTYDPNTIEHLGVRMYSTIPPVLAELISNAYDADAQNVTLSFIDSDGRKEIVIEDDGTGMSFEEINEKFLRIGRNRRLEEKHATKMGREPIGKKGLGKLSFFGIAHKVKIVTRKDGKENVFQMDWNDIKKQQGHHSIQNYQPDMKRHNEPCPLDKHGTIIHLKDIQRKTDFLSSKEMAIKISNLFIVDSSFKIKVVDTNKDESEVSNDMRYEAIKQECRWKIPGDIDLDEKYKKLGVKGILIAAEKPIRSQEMRGITLFSRNKLVNTPGFFSNSTSSHVFSYLTGYLIVNFIDDLEEDVISTNRQSLNWEHDEMKEFRKSLRVLIRVAEDKWRKLRREKKMENIEDKAGINTDKWIKGLPEEYNIKKIVIEIIQLVLEQSGVSEDEAHDIVRKLHMLVPEYPNFHWRRLHKEVQGVAKRYYENGDYHTALLEASKVYIKRVREKSGRSIDEGERAVMYDAFNMDKSPHLRVKPEYYVGIHLNKNTTNNVQAGQEFFSKGLYSGVRNVLAHGEFTDLEKSSLFTEKDCLNILGLLSHLYARLDSFDKTERNDEQ